MSPLKIKMTFPQVSTSRAASLPAVRAADWKEHSMEVGRPGFWPAANANLPVVTPSLWCKRFRISHDTLWDTVQHPSIWKHIIPHYQSEWVTSSVSTVASHSLSPDPPTHGRQYFNDALPLGTHSQASKACYTDSLRSKFEVIVHLICWRNFITSSVLFHAEVLNKSILTLNLTLFITNISTHWQEIQDKTPIIWPFMRNAS